MFCSKCGANVPDGNQFCPTCGSPMGASNFAQDVNQAFNNVEREMGSAINDVRNTFSGNPNGAAPYAGEVLKTDRGLLSYILLSIITCGIYGYYFIYKMAHDVNIACSGDGESTGGLVAFILLSLVTCGIYSWIWEYKLGNRLAANAPRYGMNFQENGTSVLMWCLFGSMLCGIGPFVAMNILIKNSNKICFAYNRQHGLM